MLWRAISSVLAQTFQDFEILVVSDGSTDNTEEVVNSFNDPRIYFIRHEEPKGASAARNTGMRECKGKYIAFLDDDDQWTPNKLDVQVPVIEQSPSKVGLIYAWMEYFRDNKSIGVHAPELRGNIFVEMLDKQAAGGCPTIIIKREVINKVGGFDENLMRGNDGDFIRHVSKYFDVDYVPEVLVKVYAGHADRISVDSVENLKNAAVGFEKRLASFKDDFDKYPQQKATVLVKLGTTYLQTGQTKKGLYCLGNMLRCKVGWLHKCELLYRTARGLAGFIFRNFLHSNRT